MYIGKLDEIVDKFNNEYQKTIKMKPIDVKWSTYIDFDVQSHGSKIFNLMSAIYSKLVWRFFFR